MNKAIRIGTRDSELALWQARTVQRQLEAHGFSAQLVPLKSTGDLQQDLPLYELGISGIFTKTLDIALLKKEVDIAVHSLKDVPTLLPKKIVQAAVLERGDPSDLLVHKGLDFLNHEGVVATGSLRRKAQWLHRYPLHQITGLRGNVNTRLQKLQDNNWNAAIFASAGLKRLGHRPKRQTTLAWMVPAPAQGAVAVMTLEDNSFCQEALAPLNDKTTALCTTIERNFLRTLEGGCTAPIGALATVDDDLLSFKGVLMSLDGQRKVAVQKSVPIQTSNGMGRYWAREILDSGGAALMQEIKSRVDP